MYLEAGNAPRDATQARLCDDATTVGRAGGMHLHASNAVLT